jgi:phosphoserine phosphatase
MLSRTTTCMAAFRLTTARSVSRRVFLKKSNNPRCFSSAAISASSTSMDAANVSPESLLEHFHLHQQQQEQSSSSLLVGNHVGDAMYALYHADAVCFDVDSTVIAEEGIDVLAEYLGKGAQVAALTKQAMEGGMKFQDALQQRLELLQPTLPSIQKLLHDHPLPLTPHVDTLMSTLQEKNVDIWLVSGGFRIMIEPIAQQLKIPLSNIIANTLLFHTDGQYAGFDKSEPTSADGGKPQALQQLQQRYQYQCMVMVGDGATDAQAKPPAQAFVGFGGVVERSAVKDQADWFVTDFRDMIQIIQQRQ